MAALLDIVTKGSTDRSVTIRIIDSTDGTPETAVVFNTAGIDLWYRREGGSVVSITEATQTVNGAHSDGGFVHIGNGEYRLDLPDAAFASGANYVDVGGTVTGMIVIGGRVRLTDVNLEDGVRAGLTALPNAAAQAAGGLYTRGTGAGQIDQPANGRIAVDATHIDGVSATNLRHSLSTMQVVTVSTGSTSTSITTQNLSGVEATNDHFKGKALYFLTGNLAKQIVEITAYNGTTGTLTVTATPSGESPANNDTALIV